MTKKQALARFREYILPGVVSHFGPNDEPARRQAWVNFVDSLHRSGDITTHQATSWDNPEDATPRQVTKRAARRDGERLMHEVHLTPEEEHEFYGRP